MNRSQANGIVLLFVSVLLLYCGRWGGGLFDSHRLLSGMAFGFGIFFGIRGAVGVLSA